MKIKFMELVYELIIVLLMEILYNQTGVKVWAVFSILFLIMFTVDSIGYIYGKGEKKGFVKGFKLGRKLRSKKK